jgi:hypothetical protein
MEFEPCVQFANVEVLDVGGRRHWRGVGRLQPGTTIARRGDRGVLVLERQFALERHLITSLPTVRSLTGPSSAP